MNSIFDPVDNYCERVATGLLGEPLNALSNASFFIAAWLLYKIYRNANKHDLEARNLIGCLVLVGCGSLIFHTFATWLAMWADIIPIMMFVFYYLWLALPRFIGWNYFKTFISLVAFMFILIQAYDIPPPYNFNGSSAYFPCLIAVWLIAWHIRIKLPSIALHLFKAFYLFTLSLFLRSIDMVVCESIPIGTHFLWHLCNGIVLYFLTKAILEQPVKQVN